MSFATATAVQRQKVRDEAVKLGRLMQPFAQDARTPTAAEEAAVATQLAATQAALAAIGT